MYHSIQQSIKQSNACDESPFKVRERCVSRIAAKKYGTKSNLPSKVRWAATTRKTRKSGRRKNLAEAPQKSEKQKEGEKENFPRRGKQEQ
eukprot:3178291-Pleurochrysis_carterae.AAC.1